MYFFRLVTIFAAVSLASAQAPITLRGRVTDEEGAPLARARISIRTGSQPPRTAETGPTGTFDIPLPAPGDYLISVQRTGYFVLSDRPLHVDHNTETSLVLAANREIFQSVNVGESSSPVDPDQTEREQRLNGTDVNDIPYPATQSFKNSLKLIPGVVQDPSAGVHFHGGAEYQTQYTLDGFDITDPITGRFNTTLAVEGIRSVDLVSSRMSPQYGRGSAGTLAIRMENGTDEYHYTATNFIPGLDTRNGFSLGDWSPRAGISGPLVKGRAWFSDSITGGYVAGYVPGLPSGQNTNPSWSAGNLLHTQVNLTQSNILFGDFLVHFNSQSHAGLGPLDPIPTTSARQSDEWLGAVKDSQAWRNGNYLEFGIAFERVFHQTTPQGDNPYVIAPEGRSGNYFVSSREHGGRKQAFLNYYPSLLHWAGRHQLQTGGDFQRLDYTAAYHRTSYEILGLNGLPEFSTVFVGPGNFHLPNSSVGTYFNDHWTPVKGLAIDAGVRHDWDRLVGQNVFAPRFATAWSPFKRAHTKLVAGYAVIYDATNLATFARPLDQQALTTPFSSSGDPGVPYFTTFLPGHNLRLPRYDQYSAGVEHDFGHGISATADWLRKRGRNGFVYEPLGAGITPSIPVTMPQFFPGAQSGGFFALSSVRRDRYDEYSVTVRQTLPNQYTWLASYVHSSATSNSVLDVNIDQTLQVTNNFGPVPWDSPNRFLSEGYLPLYFKNWALAYLADWRTGFPYSLLDPANRVVGQVDSRRFGSNFDLNIHLERRFDLFRYRFAIRLGANNVTDHRNATAVNSVVGSPNFMRYYGAEGRHLVVRLRLFGRVK